MLFIYYIYHMSNGVLCRCRVEMSIGEILERGSRCVIVSEQRAAGTEIVKPPESRNNKYSVHLNNLTFTILVLLLLLLLLPSSRVSCVKPLSSIYLKIPTGELNYYENLTKIQTGNQI